MALIKMGSVLIVVIALTFASSCQVTAYTEEVNFAFIDKILDSLNNNTECHLPSYDEIDEVQNCFNDLEATLGESLSSKLSRDQRLLKNTVLYQWESFQKRMTSAVVIKSAKFRSFLCKVEEYQRAKFGSSICTQIKVSSGPIVDRVFEKNPIVRYIKHLETHDVPDPDTAPQVIHTPIEPEPEVQPEPEPEPEPDTAEIHNEAPLADEVEKPIESELEDEAKKEEVYDPLADIPFPAAEDPVGSKDEESSKSDSSPELTTDQPLQPEEVNPIVEEEPVKKTPKPEYVEEEDNYDDLYRLGKLDRDDWDYDVRYGYFIWPDEDPKKNPKPDTSNKPNWIQFLQEPFVCVNEPEPNPEPEVKPNLRKRRKEFLNGLAAEHRYQDSQKTFGWNNCSPELNVHKPDRWVHILDNNLCNLSLNRGYKSRLLSVSGIKSMFGSKDNSSAKKRCLLS